MVSMPIFTTPFASLKLLRQPHQPNEPLQAFDAADEMRDTMPKCPKLRQGDAYIRSYSMLLRDSVWFGFPGCKPQFKDVLT